MALLKPDRILKGQITELDKSLSFFVVKDFVNDVTREVILLGKQRLEYKSYSIGDIVYAVKTRDAKWRLATDVDFKRSSILRELRKEVEAYLEWSDSNLE